jgi:hypothetical protein
MHLQESRLNGNFMGGRLQDIPKWWAWYYWICPTAWTLYGQILTQFEDLKISVVPIDNSSPSIPMREFLKTTFGFEESMLGVVVFMPILFTLLFAGVFAFAIKHLNFQQR